MHHGKDLDFRRLDPVDDGQRRMPDWPFARAGDPTGCTDVRLLFDQTGGSLHPVKHSVRWRYTLCRDVLNLLDELPTRGI